MMTRSEYEQTIVDWCDDVQNTALLLFDQGVHPQACTGIAINIVESKRAKRSAEQQKLTLPGLNGLPKH
jgi:hypothetical protein